ncbi:hypothetical protein FN846DRAFT_921336 [Sphaerosporella brunnea]|uniref:Uncharacterized protein n=1 Tax=Sphaerosporella brunnea TaxID=1250544 RepID=A0A5J5EN65_9PEZI|nr:hypothetical protein FN846DRAFT_921336 [Sphaerosporella brunnea]
MNLLYLLPLLWIAQASAQTSEVSAAHHNPTHNFTLSTRSPTVAPTTMDSAVSSTVLPTSEITLTKAPKTYTVMETVTPKISATGTGGSELQSGSGSAARAGGMGLVFVAVVMAVGF